VWCQAWIFGVDKQFGAGVAGVSSRLNLPPFWLLARLDLHYGALCKVDDRRCACRAIGVVRLETVWVIRFEPIREQSS
jgi:hypothetical protein